jgi:hypothetical protein
MSSSNQTAARRGDDSDGLRVSLVGHEHALELGGRKVHLLGVDHQIADPRKRGVLDQRNGGVSTALVEAPKEGCGSPTG